MTENLSGALFLAMLRQGKARLYKSREIINDLNVFPIPDGDTGDNMYMTIDAGTAIAKGRLCDVASAASKGMLMGARGNSGVILSRIFAGISKGLAGLEDADWRQFAAAMSVGVREAYSAVSTPVEGTILTVLREAVEMARGQNLETYFESLVKEMRFSLDRTPDLLPVLKDANVVDSGGAGILCIAEGMLEALYGKCSDVEQDLDQRDSPKYDLDDFGPDTELEFGYCTEFLLRLQTAKVGDPEIFDESVIRDWLCSVGESVVCFREGSIVKVHVHTKTPGDILSRVQDWGEFLTVKIENMTLQHSEVNIQNNFSRQSQEESFVRKKKFGVVAVVSGEGLARVFKEAGADEVIEGGRTMNPSVLSLMDAIDRVPAETVFIFPNNSNVIMTAQQAASLCIDKKVIVLPSKDPGAGYVAAASMDFSTGDCEEIAAAAKEAIASVQTGLVSRAIRDAEMDGVTVKDGDFLGIMEGRIISAAADRISLVVDFAAKVNMDGHDVVLLISGAQVVKDEALALLSKLQSIYTRTEFLLTEGGQPVYDYIIVLC